MEDSERLLREILDLLLVGDTIQFKMILSAINRHYYIKRLDDVDYNNYEDLNNHG